MNGSAEKNHRPKIGDWKPGQDLIAWSDATGIDFGRGPSGCDYRISGQDHNLMQFNKQGIMVAQSQHKSLVDAKFKALDLELLELGKKAPKRLATAPATERAALLEKKTLQLPAGAAGPKTAEAAVAEGVPSFEDQMAAQMGWAKKGLEAQKAVDAVIATTTPFPVSKGSELLDLSQLFESLKNPRQDFDEEDIAGLAESIVKTGGLMVAILARPSGDQIRGLPMYEIADGARRYRALQLLKTMKNPLGEKALVDIRPLTDAQLAEAFMTADRRKLLNPIEQARGFKNMLDVGHTVDTIASSLGVSKGTVHARLKLLELSPKAMKLFGSGLLTTAIATPLGRYPHGLQDEALEQMLGDRNREGMGGSDTWRHEERHAYSGPKLLNVGKAIAWLQEHFTKSLKTTPWDQEGDSLAVPEELWPTATVVDEAAGTVLAPSCASCPKNSNNMPAEVAGENAHGRSSAGFCTLPPCFEAKWTESLKSMRAEAKTKGDVKVLSEAASRSALKKLTNSDSRYAKASDVCHLDKKKRTWGALRELANENIDESEQIREVLAISEDEGKARLIETTEVQKVLAAQKVLPKPKKKTEPRGQKYDHDAWRAQRDREEAAANLRREIAFDVLKQYTQMLRGKGPTLPVLRMLIGLEDKGTDEVELQTFGLKNERELDAFIEKKGTVNDLVALLFMRLSLDEVSRCYRDFTEDTGRQALELKIDLKKREKDAIAAQKASEKAKAGETETTEEGDE